jgi:hypothetical protein
MASFRIAWASELKVVGIGPYRRSGRNGASPSARLEAIGPMNSKAARRINGLHGETEARSVEDERAMTTSSGSSESSSKKRPDVRLSR